MPNPTTTRAAEDLESVHHYLTIASRLMQHVIMDLQTERMTAEPTRRDELNQIADQCGDELKLINRAYDGMQGIDTDILKSEEVPA